MKLKIIFIYILVSCIYENAGAQQLINHGCYWPPQAPNGTVRTSRDSTSEDWWFDVKTVPAKHIAGATGRYICAGYSQFDDIGLGGLYTNNPCNIFQENNFSTPGSPLNFDLPDMKHMNTCGTIGLVNLTRTTSGLNPYVWIYNYGHGTIFTKVIPTSDDGFLATGYATSHNLPSPTIEPQFTNYLSVNSPTIFYQSPSSGGSGTFSKYDFNSLSGCPPFSDPNGVGQKWHACLVKVDHQGNLQWFYTYGIVSHDGGIGGVGEQAYKNSSYGSDLLETNNGYILAGILQNSDYFTNYANHPFLLQVDLNGDLQWIRQYPDAGFVAEKFSAIKAHSDTAVYVTGERTLNAGTVFCVSPPYSPISSNCINMSNNADMDHHASLRFRSFIKKINIVTGNEIWDYALTSDPNVNSKVRSLDIDTKGNILVAVSDSCAVSYERGECLNTYVSKIADFGSSVSFIKSTSFGTTRAFDLRTSLGVKATTDGGFVVVGTKKAYDLKIDKNYSVADPLRCPFPPATNGLGYNMNGFVQATAQTDGFVAKCNSSDNIEWTSIFDNTTRTPGGDFLTNAGNPRDQCNLDTWMNATTNRSKRDIKRQECFYAITTSNEGEIIIGGNMSANIDDDYMAMIENTCNLNLSNHLIQSMNSILVTTPVKVTGMNNFVASNINTGRIPGNANDVAEFIVNKGAEINIEAGEQINFYDGTDINGDLDPGIYVDAHINPLHTCTVGPAYSFDSYNINNYYKSKFTSVANGKKNIAVPVIIENGVSISPNPSTGKFLIRHPKEIKQFEVLDMYGKPLFRVLSNGDTQTNFDLNAYPAGIYLLRVLNKTVTIKLIKL